jgi:hypothetical protein
MTVNGSPFFIYYGDENNPRSYPKKPTPPPAPVVVDEEEERKKDKMQIDFLKSSRGCDMTLPAMFRKTEITIFYSDL